MSPPELRKNDHFSSESYIWNLGIILFELFYFEILEKRKNNLSINLLDDCLGALNFPYNEKLLFFFIYMINFFIFSLIVPSEVNNLILNSL